MVVMRLDSVGYLASFATTIDFMNFFKSQNLHAKIQTKNATNFCITQIKNAKKHNENVV
jgi:hypothetical protein